MRLQSLLVLLCPVAAADWGPELGGSEAPPTHLTLLSLRVGSSGAEQGPGLGREAALGVLP